MIKRIVLPLFSLVLFAGIGVHAVELTDEQRAAIAARIAPVGDVCLQGESCGGLPQPETSAKSASMVASSGSGNAAQGGSSGNAGSGSSGASGGAGAAGGNTDAASDSAESGDGGNTVAMAASSASASSVDGEAIYNQACLACHASGAGGAPKMGDVDAWTPRIAKGMDALHQSGLQGVAGTAMMAKGGRMDLSDQEVMAAVDYMVDNSQ